MESFVVYFSSLILLAMISFVLARFLKVGYNFYVLTQHVREVKYEEIKLINRLVGEIELPS